MLARHLLGASAGRPITDVAVSTAGGMWQGKSNNAAWRHGDYVYTAPVASDGSGLTVYVVDLNTMLVVRSVVVLAGAADLHASASLLVRSSDNKLVVAYSERTPSGQGVNPLVRISTTSLDTDPTLANGFGSQAAVGSSGRYTYMNLVETGAGWLYLIYRIMDATNTYGRIGWLYSSNDGATWNTPASHILAVGDATTIGPYFRCAGDGGSKIHFIATDTDRSDAHPSSLYHFYMGLTGTNMDGVYASDGTEIAPYASWPINVTDGTLIQDETDGPIDPEDLMVVDGSPVALYSVYADSDILHRVATYSSGWTKHDVVESLGLNNGNRYQVGGCFDGANPYRIFVPVTLGGALEMTRQTSPNSGTSWSYLPRTSGAPLDSFTPQRVTNGDNRCTAVYAQGTYTDDDTFSVALRGLRGI